MKERAKDTAQSELGRLKDDVFGPGGKGDCDNVGRPDPTPSGNGNGPLNAKQRDLLRNVLTRAAIGAGVGCFVGGTFGIGASVVAAPFIGFGSAFLF